VAAPIVRNVSAKKRRPKLPPLPPRLPDIPIPSDLVKTKSGLPTLSSLQKGMFQKKLMQLFAPYILPESFNAARRLIHADNMEAVKKTWESYGVLSSPKGATTIIAPQFNNENKAEAMAQAAALAAKKQDDAKGISDFESMIRMVEEGQKTILLQPAQYEPTPEGAADE
jgi:hypothetical protein